MTSTEIGARAGQFALAVVVALVGSLVIPAPVAAATKQHTFVNDDGTAGSSLKPGGQFPAVGTIIAARFRPEHPIELSKIEVQFAGTTGRKVQLHIWRDNGGLQPGAPEGWYTDKPGADLMAPKTVYISKTDGLQSIDISASKVSLPPVEPFWVGIRVVQSGATIALDAVEQKKANVTAVWQTKSGQCKDGCGVPADLRIRVTGTYTLPDAKPWFVDITKESGLKPGSRMAWADFDGDDDLDCLVAGRNLYINDGKGGFTKATDTGLDLAKSDKGLWGDVDNDGHLDLLLFGSEESIVRNDGKGKFEAFATFPEGPDGKRFPTEAAVFFDMDNDGLLDVYFANYETGLGNCDHDYLWHNKGGGKFEDVSVKFGVRVNGKQCGRGITAVDWDQDGDVDVFVGNYRLDRNFFFRNENPAPAWTDIADQNATLGKMINSAYGHTIGPSFVDADSDGDFDLFVANLAHPRFITFSDRSLFYQNLGKSKLWEFSEHRKQSGISFQETNSDARFGDFDNDGLPDLAITNVYKNRKGRIWHNRGIDKTGKSKWLRFEDVTYVSGILIDNGWGSAWPDIDGDGDVDYVANRLMRNDYDTVTGKSGNWLKVRLIGGAGIGGKVNRAAIGAWVVAELSDGRRVTRHVSCGDALSGQSGLVLHFGLGTAKKVDALHVHWPGGEVETKKSVAVGQTIELAEGFTKPKPAGDAGAGGGEGDVAGHTDGTAADGGSESPTKTTSGGDDGGCTASTTGNPDGFMGLMLVCLFGLAIRRRSTAEDGRHIVATA